MLFGQLYAPTTLTPCCDFWLLRYTSILLWYTIIDLFSDFILLMPHFFKDCALFLVLQSNAYFVLILFNFVFSIFKEVLHHNTLWARFCDLVQDLVSQKRYCVTLVFLLYSYIHLYNSFLNCFFSYFCRLMMFLCKRSIIGGYFMYLFSNWCTQLIETIFYD